MSTGYSSGHVAAEQLNRQWIGIDISPSAEDITKLRLQEIVDKGADLFNPFDDVSVRTDAHEPTHKRETTVQVNLPKARLHKHELYGLQEGKCNGCNFPFFFRNMTIDHIIPQSGGGTDRKENLQLLCQACNSTKGAETQEELIEKLIAEKYYPRGTSGRCLSP